MEEVAPEHEFEKSSEEYVANAIAVDGEEADSQPDQYRWSGAWSRAAGPDFHRLVEKRGTRFVMSPLAKVMAEHFIGIQMTGKGRLNYFIDCGLIITFLLAFLRGHQDPGLTWFFRDVFLVVPASTLSKIHDISGMVIGLLVLAHLVLHWNWIVAMTKSTFGKKT